MMPSDFIWVAEETGLIVTIGYWVIRQAAGQYKTWQQQGIEPPLISVNLSPHQFLQANLVDQIHDILLDVGMPANKLGIEITESAAMPNINYSIDTLNTLRDMGVTVFIDDFGSGFSSLSHLRKLPVDVIKIDSQFIDDIPDNSDDVAIATAIMAMSKSLNLKTVAEGAETIEQVSFLRSKGCDSMQGYYFSRPLPADAICNQYLVG